MDTEYDLEDVDGSIISIHVKNFFCHENLEVNLNRNVNFIVGRNGSGKSALLTALVVGLGGRASATNRGNNLHSFIKKGASSATVEIKIKNSSPNAYKHNLYGDSITVVRAIHASGGSSYKVKSSSGEVISTKFEEVNAIILAHDIQVDNPISVLNQDDARSFHASDAKKKYSLFRKATNLDQTEVNYMRALENCNKAQAIWERKCEASKELEKEYKKWKTIHEQLQSRDEIEAKKQALQNEYYWSEIAELEAEVETIQAQYDKQKARVDKLVEKLKHMEDSAGNNSNSIDELKEKLNEKSALREEVSARLRELEASRGAGDEGARAAARAATRQRELLRREQAKAAELQREIQAIESGSAERARLALEEGVERAEAAAAATDARVATARHAQAQAAENSARAAAAAERAARALRQKQDHIKQLQQQVRELESRADSSLAVYGARMVELCDAVRAAADSFSAPPRGPVGASLSVRDAAFAGVLEHLLGGNIRAFCVNSPDDSRLLFRLMDKVYGSQSKPPVVCSKFAARAHDVSRGAVRCPPHGAALGALAAPDPVVHNFLVDHLALETVLLVPTHEEAVRLTDTAENVPANCARVVTPDCTEYYPAPNYRCYGGVARAASLLQASAAGRRRQMQEELSAARAELAELQRASGAASAAAAGAGAAAERAARELRALQAEQVAAACALSAARAAAGDAAAPMHAVLEEELAVSKEKVSSLSAALAQHAAAEREQEARLRTLKDEASALREQERELAAACRDLTEELARQQLDADRARAERAAAAQRGREDRVKLAQVEAVVAHKRQAAADKAGEAAALCARIPRPRDKAVVHQELKQTQLKLSSLRGAGPDRAEVAAALLRVERKYRRTRAALDALQRLIEEVAGTTRQHLQFCQRVQAYIARRVQHCFQAMLALRGYTGRMVVEWSAGTLDVQCWAREAATAAGAGSGRRGGTSSLSGGERSYSTVAFIMALWDCVDLPFYFMDEFDVFMDNVNRKIVMELLVEHALAHHNRQYVFLTPQDTAVRAAPRLSLHRMADPRP